MSVESPTAAIQQFWANAKPLTNSIPADRIYTGAPPIRDENQASITYPYASLTSDGETDSRRYSSGRRECRELIKISVWHTSYDAARAAAKLAFDWLQRQSIAFDGGQILDINGVNRTDEQDSKTLVWKITVTFRALCIYEAQRIMS